MRQILKYIQTGIKGACMGAADVIPGVSGGTIAFIMGIYDEFVGSIASINAEAAKLLFSGKFKAFWKHINGGFLISLLAGIGVSIVGLAGLMQMLLTEHPIQTWAFFFGLIIASSIFILRGISDWHLRDYGFIGLGIILGIVVCTLSPTQTPDGLWFIFISGAIAICAMILPGISGSFILLILGKYQYIMEKITLCVENLGSLWGATEAESGLFWNSLLVLGVFLIGAVVGILAFSKLLHWLLARWNKETMIVLAGFIIGSLVKVWPWSNTEAIVCSQFPDVAHLGEVAEEMASAPGIFTAEQIANAQQQFDSTVQLFAADIDPQTGSAIIFALAGLFLVSGIEIAGKIISKKKQVSEK